MKETEMKSKFWMRKWQEANWEDFRELEVGDIFDTSVSNHKQMADGIGHIIFWYRTDKGKEGIYFITKVIGEPKQDDAYRNAYSMSLQVIKTIINNPVKLEKSSFNNLMADIDAQGQGGGIANILEKYQPEKIFELVSGNEKIEVKDIIKEIDIKELEIIEEIKKDNINDGKMFNPFLDMNLVKNEVRHLSFLTNLLNPNGSHHQGTKFLEIFLKSILNYDKEQDNQKIKDFSNNDNIYVQTEKKIKNGRIDIWIENDEYIIAIEGKTESVDSKGQLNKYDEYLQTLDKPYLLIYLTIRGEEPKNEYPENLLMMNFEKDIMTFIKQSLEIDLPDKVFETLNEYYNSMITYINGFNTTWSYNLDLIDEITKDEESYKKYENIKNNYFYNTKKYKYSVVEDIAFVFEKAKAKIERDFLWNLLNIVHNNLGEKGFYVSEKSDILKSNFPDNGDIDINFDINTIFEKRKNRTSFFKNDDLDSIREKSGIAIIYVKEIAENEYIRVTILNDRIGLNIYFNHVKDELCINYFEEKNKEIMDGDVFYSKNIEKLLDKSYSSKLIEECKIKILKADFQNV